MVLYDFIVNDEKWKNVRNRVNRERKYSRIWPNDDLIYNSFKKLTIEKIKVVIIGQDPYYTPNTAVGRAFGVKGDKIPPSLINIKKEIKRSLNQDLMDYTLEKWQNQGVLLLNTILSVREGDPMSHSKMGWQDLTIELLRKAIKINSDIVVVGLGNYAIKITEALEHELVINTSHPSPLSAYRGFNNSDIFRKINIILKEKNKEPIQWGENVQE